MTMPDYKTYRLKITVLTPLHIGNGREMLRGYDFAEKYGELWRFDENALLETQNIDDPKIVEQLSKAKPADLITDDREYKDGSALFRYHIPGEVRADQGRVREFIKNVYDQPYLPGSSLKGALRTAIGWWEWGQKQKVAQETDLFQLTGKKKKKEFVASDYELDIFGRKPNDAPGSHPNYDLMRSLQVSDSQPLEPDALHVTNVTVFRKSGTQPKINRITSLEVLPTKLSFSTTLKLDIVLFSQWAKNNGLNLGNASRVTNFVQICRAYTRQRIATEQEYYRRNNFPATSLALAFYDQLARIENQLAENAFWLQLGWGTGWDGKTFDSKLKENPSANYLKRVIELYDLGRGHTYAPIQTFPMSRRLPLSPNDSSKLGKPLGWVLVEIAE
jgi:CRISPR-associated protein Csm5